MTNTTLAKATRNFQRVAASSDIDAAIHWMENCSHTCAPFAHPRTQDPRPARAASSRSSCRERPLPPCPSCSTPDGYSPDGTPNWFLNHQRLEHAGLTRSLVPPTQAELRRQKDAAS